MKKRILITGASGYLGKELIKSFKNKYIVCGGSRNNKNNFLASNETGAEYIPLDVANYNSVIDSINYFKPHIIIHAAATKFVDLSEKFPLECIEVNVEGSKNIARAAIEKNIHTVIGISTDKASPPVKNIYGLSKSIMERTFISLSKNSNTKFVLARYGNVAWSTGSVFTVWKEMIKKNNIILTTGPHMRRFIFSVEDAVNLVTFALNNSKKLNGKIVSTEMKSAKMLDILKIWIKNFGGKYKVIDERPGERIDEYLIGQEEIQYTSILKKRKQTYYVIDFDKQIKKKSIIKPLSSLNAKKLNDKEIINILKLGI
jgi:UDP-N-acetylglucosamine 4,6-dehydratase